MLRESPVFTCIGMMTDFYAFINEFSGFKTCFEAITALIMLPGFTAG